MVTHVSIEAIADRGLAGDRYAVAAGTYSGRRLDDAQRAITFIEQEALDAVRVEHGIELGGHETRRNIVTRGIALNDLVGRRFRVGEVELLGVDLAVPCAYLESLTRPGVLRALVDRGGVRAEIVVGGTITVGDEIDVRP
jgi:MOSC domain-containing protein YiiM